MASQFEQFVWGSSHTTGIGRVSVTARLRIEQAVKKAIPKPTPPKIKIAADANVFGVDIEEENLIDETYQDAVIEWETRCSSEIDQQFTNLIILTAMRIDTIVAKAEVDNLDEAQKVIGLEPIVYKNIKGEDYPQEAQYKIRFIREVCNTHPRDWLRVQQMLYRDIPTEEGVAESLATFRD